MPIFEVLGMMFSVSKTTANDCFHYWLPILRDLLPSSLLEEWQRLVKDDEFVKELLTSHELLVDSFEQGRERPTDYQEQEKFYSGKQKKHTFKNQIVSLPKGNDIADAVVGERGPEADINLLRKQQKCFSKNQKFKGDKAYQSAERTTTPRRKKPKQELSQAQLKENRKLSLLKDLCRTFDSAHKNLPNSLRKISLKTSKLFISYVSYSGLNSIKNRGV